MKKLSLYIFLVLMWCNVGFANQKIYGGKSAELVYSCTTETWGNEEIPFAFSYIDDLFAKGAWIVHSYDYQKNENGPAISDLVEIDIGFSWVEAHEHEFFIFLLQYKENDLKSDINNKINLVSQVYIVENFDTDDHRLNSEILNLRKELFDEKNYNMFLEKFKTYSNKMSFLAFKLSKSGREPLMMNYKCKKN